MSFKTFRTILLVVLCIVLVASIVSAKIIDGWKYEIPKTTIAPVIDGYADGAWKTIDWNFARSDTNISGGAPDDWADLCLVTKLMYDDNNLYALYYVQDESPAGNDAAVADWQRNDVELYIDPDNSKDPGPNVAVTDFHISMRHEYTGIEIGNLINLGLPAGTDTAGIEWVMRDDANMVGWWMEFKIPLATLTLSPVETTIGVECQSNDNDGAGRTTITKWWELAGDSSWQFASSWGTGTLSPRVLDDKYEINKLPSSSTVVIDGEMDAVYANANSITTNSLGNVGTYPYDFADHFFRTYVTYDDNNLYAFFNVYDENTAGNDAAVADWQRNDVEFYIDPDYSRDAGPNLAVTDFHISIRHEYIDNEVGQLLNLGLPTGFDTVGIEFKIKDIPAPTGYHEAPGYNVEIKIPLASLNLSPVEGTVIGFEAQSNDNDGAGREGIAKWWEEVGDSSWQFANSWGTAKLGPVVGSTDVEKQPTLVAKEFGLAQNYPNPFNPSTEISFNLAKSAKVKLAVYNLLGKEVAVLVNGTRSAGPQTVTFNAKNLSSGVYFYKLESGSTVLAKKMMLLK